MTFHRSGSFLRKAQELAESRVEMSEEEGAESGFTLIELMVVLLIMAILLAIAIPTFLGVKSSAQDRSTQSDITNAVTSAKAVYTQGGSYPTIASLVSQLQSTEPELSFVSTTAHSTGTPHQISVAVSTDGSVLILASQSADGRCWFAEDNEYPAGTTTIAGLSTSTYTNAQGIHYAGSPAPGTGATGCSASSPPASVTSTGWGSSYPA
jgi:type IV pilus assembly protein PilA